MREIKFRAWDGEHNQMVYDEAMPNLTVSLLEDGSLNIGHYFENGDWYELIPMQFTGVKVQGAELYEGDIIEDDEFWYQIIWDESNGQFLAKDIYNSGEYMSLDEITRSSIQGNIYENPDLIKN